MSTDDQWSSESFDDQQRGGWEEEEGGGAGWGGLEPPKKGMSTALKLVIIIGCIGGGCVLLCCGGVVYWVYKIQPTKDSQEIIAITKEIADIDIPDNFVPQQAVNMNVLVFKMKFAVYQSPAPDGSLMLMLMDVPAAGNGPAQEAQMREALQQQGHGGKNLTIKKSESREFEVRGEKVSFNFAEAEATTGGDLYRQVKGTFTGKNGTVILMYQIEEEGYDEEAVIKMIESIK